MQIDQRSRVFGQGNGVDSTQAPQAEAGANAWDRYKTSEAMKQMFAITGVSSFLTVDSDGQTPGFQITVRANNGTEFHVGVPKEVHDALLDLHTQLAGHPPLQQDVEEQPGPVTQNSLEHPTGTPEEISVMQQRLAQMGIAPGPDRNSPVWESEENPMSKIGFVSDEGMGSSPVDPVEEVLFLANNVEDEEDELMEYGEDEFGEDIGQM